MEAKNRRRDEMIWACLLHMSYNMWLDREAPEVTKEHIVARPYLRFDTKVWNALLKKMVEARMNMVVIDLGDAVKYESHPEIAVRRAWTVKRLRRELARLRKMGLEPIPKLNFSATHDAWLGPYSRCVSTDTYYGVCADLIAEVSDLFDRPRFFHLGMDEETARHQRNLEYVVIRQHNLWWHDLHFLIEQVEMAGVRPWVWSDYLWNHPDEFFRKMPRSVLQSNWYYGSKFDRRRPHVRAYLDLEARGYDQVPTGSNWSHPENFERTVTYCARRIAPERLLGFLQTPWKPTLPDCRRHNELAIQQVGRAIARWSQA